MYPSLRAMLNAIMSLTSVVPLRSLALWSTVISAAAPIVGMVTPFSAMAQAEAQTVRHSVSNGPTSVKTHKRAKILYVEGEPRIEIKFLRRAVDADENLQLVMLLRTAKGRFLRMGIDDSLELARGFPTTQEELFKYHAVVIGSVEASFFSRGQLQLIADFVKRGGGFLMLGGRKSFAEGGYAGTVLADVLPVQLPKNATSPWHQRVKVNPTPAGARSPAMRLAATETESAQRWKQLPEVSSINRIAGVKPGADALLLGVGTEPKGGDPEVVLASQRYGLGMAWAFTIQDSWLWQQGADASIGKTAYQTFWRQILGSLSAAGPKP
jgi:uncharacterized membrane protein